MGLHLRQATTGGSRKSTLVLLPIVQFFLCTVVLCSTKILRLDTEIQCMYQVQCTSIMEFAISRNISAIRKTMTSDKSKRAPRIVIGSTFFSFA